MMTKFLRTAAPVLHARFPGGATVAAVFTAMGITLAMPMHGPAHAEGGPVMEAIESMAERSSRLDRMFTSLDRDGDGVVSGTEISARRGEAFDAFDTDGDGELTISEIAAAQEVAREMMRQAATLRSVSRARSYTEADTDGNGTLSKAEFSEARSRIMERVDANGDGDITREEAEQARLAMREMRGRNRGFGRWHHGGHQ